MITSTPPQPAAPADTFSEKQCSQSDRDQWRDRGNRVDVGQWQQAEGPQENTDFGQHDQAAKYLQPGLP